MSFNPGAGLDPSQVTGGGSNRGGVLLGGGAGGIILTIIIVLLGGNPGSLSTFNPGQVTQGNSSNADFSHCRTGADANTDDTCRVIGTVNSVQDYWADALPAEANRQYRGAKTVLYSTQTQSACGTASRATGPFYCPADERVYVDVSFFQELTSRFGADGGALAQEYVIAHEYGHHIQNILGILAKAQDGRTGPDSGSVRTELMADCLGGVWAHHAATTEDANGNTLLAPLTDRDIKSALSAAAAVGDDHIQQSMGGGIDQESWTHGSSASRQKWFLNGYRSGDLNSCDTFASDDL